MSSKAPNRGFHPILDKEQPYLFVDACMQAWADADYANAHRHGVHAIAVTAFEPTYELDAALEGMMFWHLIARKYPNTLVVERVEDIRRARQEGKLAFILASQGGDFIGSKLHRLEVFYRLGLRMLALAYSANNLLADGVLDCTDGGMSSLGKRVVQECNRLGIVLDGAHTGRRATLEMIAASAHPVVFSHANVKALCDNPRNIDDEQVRACAARGGVIGVVNWGPLLLKKGMTTRPAVEHMLEHVDYLAQLTGSTACIGIGTDFSLGSYPRHSADPWGAPAYLDTMAEYNKIVPANPHLWERFAEGFCNYPQVVEFTAWLERRGYRQQDIAGILGENMLRVFSVVWK